MYRWINNFLTDRMIYTQIEGVTSTKECLKEGIPQGSSLSCTLFTLYINGIMKYVPDTHTTLYADDLVLWSTSANMYSAQATVNTSLRNLWTYCNLWKLKLNTSNTVYTIFSRRYKVEKNVKIRYGGEEIQKYDAPQYLGLQLDPQLSMRKHIENTAEKARRRLHIVKKLASTKWEANKQTLWQLYMGYVRPTLEYSSAALSTATHTNLATLDKVHNQAFRFISGAMKTTPTSACDIECNIEPLVPCSRENIATVAPQPLHRTAYQPTLCPHLIVNSASKAYPAHILKCLAAETIDTYPNTMTHVYTDGSALNAVEQAGYGPTIQYPDATRKDISEVCGKQCNIYDA